MSFWGRSATRRDQATTLLQLLKLDHRLYSGTGISESTWKIAFGMLEGLADAVHTNRIDFHERAVAITGNPSGPVAGQALLDFGWGHLHIAGGDVRDVMATLPQIYSREMSMRVERLLDRWEKVGIVSNKAPQKGYLNRARRQHPPPAA